MYWLDRSLFNQLGDFNRLIREMDRAFRSPLESRASFPKLNIWKNNDAVIITAEVPGVDPQKLELAAEAEKVVISGEVCGRSKTEGEAYQRCERSTGKFHRELNLPFRIDTGKVSAQCKNGILKISLSRAEEDKPRKVSVTVT